MVISCEMPAMSFSQSGSFEGSSSSSSSDDEDSSSELLTGLPNSPAALQKIKYDMIRGVDAMVISATCNMQKRLNEHGKATTRIS